MRPAEEIDQLIKKINLKASANLDKRVSESILNAQVKQQNKQSAQMQPNIWRIIMKNPITKLASAAVIVVAVLVISFPFSNSGVAWASLAEKIEKVKTVVFRITTNATMQNIPQEQMQNQETIAYYSSEYGSRVEQYVDGKFSFIMYLNPKENLQVSVIPEQKMFQRFTGRSQEELQRISDGDDPRVMVRSMMSGEYKHLGKDTIDGIEVEGIECTGPGVMGGIFEDATARLWVEVGTDYPVRIEIKGTVSGGQMEMSMVMDNFQWDVELDEALFIPDIPEDYTSQEMNISGIATVSEGAAINGLKTFTELTEGKYPSNLALMTLLKEVSEVFGKKYGIKIAQAQGFTSELQEYTSALQDILAAGTFYAQLQATGKEAVYYGDTVTAADSDKVLLRWKVSDDVYRVVFADLSAGNVSTEELAELEK